MLEEKWTKVGCKCRCTFYQIEDVIIIDRIEVCWIDIRHDLRWHETRGKKIVFIVLIAIDGWNDECITKTNDREKIKTDGRDVEWNTMVLIEGSIEWNGQLGEEKESSEDKEKLRITFAPWQRSCWNKERIFAVRTLLWSEAKSGISINGLCSTVS